MSLFIGGTFVGILAFLGHHDLATPAPFWLLLPGILAGAVAQGSEFNLKEDHTSALSTLVVYAVNVALYGGLANLLLNHRRRIILSRK